MTNGVHIDDRVADEESVHENDDEIQEIATDLTDVKEEPENTEKIDEVVAVAENPQLVPPHSPNRTVADVDVHSNPDRDDITPPQPAPKEKEQDSQSGSDNVEPDVPPVQIEAMDEKPKEPDVVDAETLRISDKSERKALEPMKQNGDITAYDETDRGMTESEKKTAEVMLSIDCTECHSKSCVCNVSSLLVSNEVM